MKKIAAAMLLGVAALFVPVSTEAIYCEEAVMRWFPYSGWVCLYTTEGGEVCTLCSEEIVVPG